MLYLKLKGEGTIDIPRAKGIVVTMSVKTADNCIGIVLLIQDVVGCQAKGESPNLIREVSIEKGQVFIASVRELQMGVVPV